MTGSIWVSLLPCCSSPHSHDFADVVGPAEPGDVARSMTNGNSGEPLTREQFPAALRFIPSGSPPPFDALNINGRLVVAEKAAEVLNGFDLGRGSLFAVDIFRADRARVVSGPFYFWNVGNRREALLAHASRDLRPFGLSGLTWNMPWVVEDDTLAVSRAGLGSPDAWVDPGLIKSLFLSAPLGDAILAAGLEAAFGIRRVRVT